MKYGNAVNPTVIYGDFISDLGGVAHSQSNKRGEIGYGAGGRQQRENDIWLKLEEIR